MVDSLKATLGARVRAARQHIALTQEALAAQIGRTPESVSNIERGLQLPNIETLVELGRILAIPVGEFFDGSADEISTRSAERLALEARLRELARTLSDRDLAIVVKQVSAFLE